ncbi:MAG TPA: NlpC/P60 family protein [Rhodanobacteraceae bacterium]|nr:NlpC/P60 family protein [Rhodanobacteraceae bacterium]
MIPAWAGEYVGLPYADKGRSRDGADCWGGVRMVYREVFGIDLPDYADAYTSADERDSVAQAVEAGLTDGWESVTVPHGGDLLILRVAGRPWHCAIMVNDAQFLHWPPPNERGEQQLSCIDRIDAPRWAKRLGGWWRHA